MTSVTKRPHNTYLTFLKKNWVLILIFLIAIFFRFYGTPNQYPMDGDAVRDAIVAHEATHHLFFPLTGPFSSTGPFTFGPWYYYSLILTAFFVPTPYSPWILMSVVSLVSVFLMYKIGILLESKKLGLLLAFITAIAPTQISAGTRLSNICPVSFFTILSVWLMLLIIKGKSTKLLPFLLGVTLGLGINAHFQAVGLLLLPVLLWLYKGWRKIGILFFVGLGLFITFIPLLLFNLQTEWYTIRGIHTTYVMRDRIYVPNSWKIYLTQFLPSYLYYFTNTSTFLMVPIVFVSVGVLVLRAVKKNLNPGVLLMLLLLGINFLNLRYYWGERNFVYLFYMEPIIFIVLGYGLFQLMKYKFGKPVFIGILAFISLSMLAKDYHELLAVSVIHRFVNTEVPAALRAYPDKKIAIYSCDTVPQDKAHSLALLLSFEDMTGKPPKNIGLIAGTKCEYPKTASFNYTDATMSALMAPRVYPYIRGSESLVDFSIASDSAIKTASWSAVSTYDVYESTLKWWKHKELL